MTTAFRWLAAALMAAPAFAGDLFDHPRTPAQAQATLHAAMPGHAQVQVLRGRFSQRKYLREIPRPLVSAGEFVLVRDRGIWWHSQTPLDSELTLTPHGMIQRNAGTQARPAGIEAAAAIFFALFALDLDTLAHSFDLFEMGSDSHWLLGLRPRDAALANWFERATISGGERVEQVTLVEAAGDRTEINLEAAEQPLWSLTPAERQRFEP